MLGDKRLTGGALVVLGAVLLLGALDVWDAGTILRDWWPLALVAAGLWALVRPPRAWVGGTILTAIGLVALGLTTDLVPGVGAGAVWAVVLMGVGVWIAVGAGRDRTPSPEDHVAATSLFSSQHIISLADPFRGGSIAGIFGGVELDLTGASLQDGAVLEAIGIFGAAEITVPPGWHVVAGGPALFGGIENGAGGQVLPDGAPTLHVRSLALFGGVEIALGALPPAARDPHHPPPLRALQDESAEPLFRAPEL